MGSRFELTEAELTNRYQELQEGLEKLNRREGSLEPWARPLRDLECQLKGLLASQVEDSTAVFRSVAMMVEELRQETPCPPSCQQLGHVPLTPTHVCERGNSRLSAAEPLAGI